MFVCFFFFGLSILFTPWSFSSAFRLWQLNIYFLTSRYSSDPCPKHFTEEILEFEELLGQEGTWIQDFRQRTPGPIRILCFNQSISGNSRCVQMCLNQNWPLSKLFSKPHLNPCCVILHTKIERFCLVLFVRIKRHPPVHVLLTSAIGSSSCLGSWIYVLVDRPVLSVDPWSDATARWHNWTCTFYVTVTELSNWSSSQFCWVAHKSPERSRCGLPWFGPFFSGLYWLVHFMHGDCVLYTCLQAMEVLKQTWKVLHVHTFWRQCCAEKEQCNVHSKGKPM